MCFHVCVRAYAYLNECVCVRVCIRVLLCFYESVSACVCVCVPVYHTVLLYIAAHHIITHSVTKYSCTG